MSDDFEQLYFGSSVGGDPLADADGDGRTNLEEFLAGTSPVDAQSVLRIAAIRRQGDDLVAVFLTVAHKAYRLEAASSLDVPFTIPIATIRTGETGGVLEVTDAGGAAHGRRFYRVTVIP